MRVPLINSEQYALVSDEDADLIAPYTWVLDSRGYVRASAGKVKQRHALMHRMVLNLTDPDVWGDHINGNRLDNRRTNLRPVTPGQNGQNTISRGGRSRYRGVWLDTRRKRRPWVAEFKIGGKKCRVGRFRTEYEAAQAVNTERLKAMPFARPDPGLIRPIER